MRVSVSVALSHCYALSSNIPPPWLLSETRPFVGPWPLCSRTLLHPGDCGEVSQPAPAGSFWTPQKDRWAALGWERKLGPWKQREERTGLAVTVATRPPVKCLNITEVLVKPSVKSTSGCPFTYSWNVFVFALYAEFITAIQMNLKKNRYCCGGLSSENTWPSRIAGQDGLPPSLRYNGYTLCFRLNPVLAREACCLSKVSPGLSAKCRWQLSLYSRLTNVTNDMTYYVTTSKATLLDLCEAER